MTRTACSLGGTAAVIDDCGEDEAAIVTEWAGGESTDVLVPFVGTCWFRHGSFMLNFDDGINPSTSLAVQNNTRNNNWKGIYLSILVQLNSQRKQLALVCAFYY